MEKRIIECVPNFSEGRDMSAIKQITDVIESVEKVKLLDVDPGKDTNRTVVTFVGEPEAVAEAAFLAVKKASEVIDMSKHKGEHPRMGATDVCPFIPVSGITMEETVLIARKVAERIGNELGIPVFCYENAAFKDERRNLAACRSGEYEGLEKKLAGPEWKPDFGPAVFNKKSGATAVGARDFLVAFNVNLNTTSTRRANAIAFDVREKGRDIIKENSEKINIPGTLKSVKAIGWYIEEYGIAQISMNLTNIPVTPVHIAFDEVCRKAEARGIRVTGSELVGLIPLKSLLDAGKYFLEKQQRSSGVPDEELIKIAVKSMGLSELHHFRPEEKIIEYVMGDKTEQRLIAMSLRRFMNSVASESPAPGGGSVSAYMGALGSALGTMVANLSGHKKGWDDRWQEFSEWAVKGKGIQNELLSLVDADTEAYNMIIQARRMPKSTEEEVKSRNDAIQNAYKEAILVPLRVMETAFSGFDLIRNMVEKGNPSSVSDAAVGSLALLAAINGAYLNVRINSSGVNDQNFITSVISKGSSIVSKAQTENDYIQKVVDSGIGL
ncbi:MAG TPA: glutamate formimidoyltransferase [Bacteroidales bacterium]|nr:glutamate formimidoyltransferase [Bacteroidales bacterium]HPM86926.1 glutamate formimidoyltransferase [Bacteroidales bacterium]